MNDYENEIVTLFLDFGESESDREIGKFRTSEYEIYNDLLLSFANELSKYLVSSIIRKRGVDKYLESEVDTRYFEMGLLLVELRWKKENNIFKTDEKSKLFLQMLDDAIDVLVMERHIESVSYKVNKDIDNFYSLNISGNEIECYLYDGSMIALVNRLEKLLVKLGQHQSDLKLYIYSIYDDFQLPALDKKRSFPDFIDPELEIECTVQSNKVRCENRIFKITLSGKTQQYYLDDVDGDLEEYLSRRARHNDLVRMKVKPVRTYRRGDLGNIVSYRFIEVLEEDDEGQKIIRYNDEGGRRS